METYDFNSGMTHDTYEACERENGVTATLPSTTQHKHPLIQFSGVQTESLTSPRHHPIEFQKPVMESLEVHHHYQKQSIIVVMGRRISSSYRRNHHRRSRCSRLLILM